MSFNYRELEKQLTAACNEVQKGFTERYSSNNYVSAGGGAMLEAFISELQREFENTAAGFIKKHSLEKDAQAKQKVLSIAKMQAKKCIEEFSKI